MALFLIVDRVRPTFQKKRNSRQNFMVIKYLHTETTDHPKIIRKIRTINYATKASRVKMTH